MQKLLLSFILFFGAAISQAQTNAKDHSATIKEQAGNMGKLLVGEDFTTFTRYTHPQVIKMMGGKEKMIATLKKGFKDMQEQGTAIQKVTIGDPSKVILVKNELQATVPQTIEMKVPNGKLKTQSTLIAVSLDNGKNWYFMDTSGKDLQAMKKIFPSLSEQLVIPAQKKPTFYEN